MRSDEDVIRFWFVEHGMGDWFGGKPEFDAVLKAGFEETHQHVAKGEAWNWRGTPKGRLAEIIVLDQFSRQLHRGSPLAFSQDKMALVLAQEMIAQRLDLSMSPDERMFILLPFMHSESPVIQAESMRLHEALGDEKGLDFATKHRDCIARFGRYPFRNKALGRQSTDEELAYMEEAGKRGF
ncbi:DUF924 family protein [Devosia sp. SL43]|uniref:DUF924 family protein n=1 Tax=Devosia sp. SL43 TaxID=2806348 RepID=UPI001F43158C|nr:DUF924 family protein [Devosia sp. SL43]UJW84935.1 DUF924 domain-containing protein [Devosia sp. SL43]